jgi:hypothetical protein
MEFYPIAQPKEEQNILQREPEQLSDFDKYLMAVALSRLGIRRKMVVLKRYLERVRETGIL